MIKFQLRLHHGATRSNLFTLLRKRDLTPFPKGQALFDFK